MFTSEQFKNSDALPSGEDYWLIIEYEAVWAPGLSG
jgi:hypothetical protein